jgi:poly(3-hydroxybutyrate) depolymerase
MAKRLTALFAAAAFLVTPAPTGAQSAQPTFLGVVDEHGQLTPIAVYDGAS